MKTSKIVIVAERSKHEVIKRIFDREFEALQGVDAIFCQSVEQACIVGIRQNLELGDLIIIDNQAPVSLGAVSEGGPEDYATTLRNIAAAKGCTLISDAHGDLSMLLEFTAIAMKRKHFALPFTEQTRRSAT